MILMMTAVLYTLLLSYIYDVQKALCTSCKSVLFSMYAGPTLKMDQAMLTLHNRLTEDMQVFYTSDYCYKVENNTVSVCLFPPSICLSSSLCLLRYEQVSKTT